MSHTWPYRKRSTWKGIIAGVAGGLAGAYTMGLFDGLCTKASEKFNAPERHKKLQRAAADAQEATSKAAERILRPALGRRLHYREREAAKPVVHYAFGTAVGALYGAAAERIPVTKALCGAPFGAAVFAGAHGVALPALNLTKDNRAYPFELHATEFGSHIVYGMTLEGVRRLTRWILRA